MILQEVLTGSVALSTLHSSRSATGVGCRDLYDLWEQMVHVRHVVQVVDVAEVVAHAEVVVDVAFPDFSWA